MKMMWTRWANREQRSNSRQRLQGSVAAVSYAIERDGVPTAAAAAASGTGDSLASALTSTIRNEERVYVRERRRLCDERLDERIACVAGFDQHSPLAHRSSRPARHSSRARPDGWHPRRRGGERRPLADDLLERVKGQAGAGVQSWTKRARTVSPARRLERRARPTS